MIQEDRRPVLTRMLRNASRVEVKKQSEASQLRSIIRQAAAMVGLHVVPIATELSCVDVDDLVRSVDAHALFVALRKDWQIVGYCTVDLPLVVSLRELQTRGAIGSGSVEARDPTAADCVFAIPLLNALIQGMHGFTGENNIPDLLQGVSVETSKADRQVIAAQLGNVRLVHAEVSVAVDTSMREGRIGLALCLHEAKVEANNPARSDEWRHALSTNVLASRAVVRGILTRIPLPLRAAQAFAVGDVIPLTGVHVSGVRLETKSGSLVAQGRLGQAAGLRAVRVEAPANPTLVEGPLPLACAELLSSDGGGAI